MNPIPKFRYNRLLALCATLGLTCLASAQTTTVTTAPVGAMTKTIPVGITPVGISLINSAIVGTTVTAANASTLTLGTANVGSLLTSTEPYYLEVTGGDLKGDRFDINVAATIAANNNTVVLLASSIENTFPSNSVGTLLNGFTIQIRKHFTIEQIQQCMSTALTGNNNSALADQIHVFNNNTNSYVTHYLRGDLLNWRLAGTTTVTNKSPIHPGKGVFILKQNNAAVFTIVGNVRTNDFVQKFGVGNQLMSTPWPVDFSPDSYKAFAVNGWTGNNNSALADQIQVYNSTSRAFDAYYLRSDGLTWRKAGTTTVVTTAGFMTADTSYFVKRMNADAGFLYVNSLVL